MLPPKRSSVFVNPPPRRRPEPPVVTASKSGAADEPASDDTVQRPPDVRVPSKPRPSSTKAKGVKTEKRIPLGDYAEGYCRAPKKYRFKDGNPGGPGRPKASKSQNALMRAAFERKHSVREGGKTIRKTAREVLSMLFVTDAIQGRKPLQVLKAIMLAQQLFPDPIAEAGPAEAFDPKLDEFVLQNLFAALKLGEASVDGETSFADAATGQPDLGQPSAGDAWDEGDWNAPDEEVSDEDR